MATPIPHAEVLKMRQQGAAELAQSHERVAAARLTLESSEANIERLDQLMRDLDCTGFYSLGYVAREEEFYRCEGRDSEGLRCDRIIHLQTSTWDTRAQKSTPVPAPILKTQREHPLCSTCETRTDLLNGTAFALGLGEEFDRTELEDHDQVLLDQAITETGVDRPEAA